MDGAGLSPTTASVEAALLRTAEGKMAETAALLKKSLDADKSMIEKLLPLPKKGLDISA